MSNKYSIVVLRDEGDCEYKHKEVKSFVFHSLYDAQQEFNYQADMLKWSLKHKTGIGLRPNDCGRVWLFDHQCGYELREQVFN